MEVIDLLKGARDCLATRGKAEFVRMDPEGRVCALGALDVTKGGFTTPSEYEDTFFRPGFWAVHEDALYQKAVGALASTAPLRNATGVLRCPYGKEPLVVVAWNSNNLPTDEVLHWFDDTILQMELSEHRELVSA